VKVLTVCINVRKPPFASCGARGSLRLLEELKGKNLPLEIQTIACLGKCEIGPNARLSPGNHWFNRIASADELLQKLEELNAT
jgi:hypothetical protein